MITLLVIFSMLSISAYTIAVCVKQKKLPYSISATFYKLEHKFWFGVTMWITAGLLMPAVLEMSNVNSEWSAFLSCIGMFIVGAAPNFREKKESIIHDIGATMSLTFSQAWVAFNKPVFLSIWLLYLIYSVIYVLKQKDGNFIYKFIKTKPMFWIEIVALLITYLTILFK